MKLEFPLAIPASNERQILTINSAAQGLAGLLFVVLVYSTSLWEDNLFCLQGLDISEKGLDLISSVIRQQLGIECSVLMGANIAGEVANENFCEATIGKYGFMVR